MSYQAGDTVPLKQGETSWHHPIFEILLLEERKSKACGVFFLSALYELKWDYVFDTSKPFDPTPRKGSAFPTEPLLWSSTKSDAITLMYFYPDTGKITVLGGKKALKNRDFSGFSVWDDSRWKVNSSEKVEVVEVMQKE